MNKQATIQAAVAGLFAIGFAASVAAQPVMQKEVFDQSLMMGGDGI